MIHRPKSRGVILGLAVSTLTFATLAGAIAAGSNVTGSQLRERYLKAIAPVATAETEAQAKLRGLPPSPSVAKVNAAVAPLATSIASLQKVLAPPPPSNIIYSTNWQDGDLGWSSDGDGTWSVVDHELVFDGGGASVIVAPVKLKNVQNYAIQAKIQYQREDGGASDFGLIAHTTADPRFSDNGVEGIMGGEYSNNPGDTADIWSGGLVYDTTDLGKSDYTLDHLWHVWRLEVRGNQYRLLIDGRLATSGASNQYLSNTRVGLFSGSDEINVQYFRVYRLS